MLRIVAAVGMLFTFVVGTVVGKRWGMDDHDLFGCKYRDEIDELKQLLVKISEAEAATDSQKQLVDLLQAWLMVWEERSK